jgi:hypothetical protein
VPRVGEAHGDDDGQRIRSRTGFREWHSTGDGDAVCARPDVGEVEVMTTENPSTAVPVSVRVVVTVALMESAPLAVSGRLGVR